MATATTAPAPAPAAPSASELLDMTLDEVTKRDKQEERKRKNEERKAKLAEKKAAAAAAAAAKPASTKAAGEKKIALKNKPAAAKGKAAPTATKTNPAPAKANQKNTANVPPRSEKPPLTTGTPVMVSNLNAGIDIDELKEIFQAVGSVKLAEKLPYNGVSHAARITFKNKADAVRAVEEFDGRLLDEKPMKVKIVRKRVKISTKETEQTETTGGAAQGQQHGNKRQRKSNA